MGVDHIVGKLECCFRDAGLYFVDSGEPLKSFELRWGEIGENSGILQRLLGNKC